MKLYRRFIVLCFVIAFCIDGAVGKESPRPRIAVQSQKTKECPPGFTLKGKACESLEIVEPNYVCPPGTSSSNGRCVTQSPAKPLCPSGYALQGNSCTRVVTAPAEYFCEEGSLEGKNCVIVVPKSPYCPNGYRMDGDSCTRFAPVLKKCPAGYAQQSKECLKRVSFPASPSCNFGFELSSDGTKCFKFEERKSFCPSGFQMGSDGQCTRFVQKVRAPCPAGYRNAGNRCEMTEQFPAEAVCPEEMTLEQQTKTCTKLIPVPPQCPGGFVPSKTVFGECERFLPSRAVCPSGSTASGNGQCKQKVTTEKYPKCPSGYEMIGEKCKKVDEYPTKSVCLSGRLQGENCVTSETVSPQYICADGFQLTKTSKGPQCTQSVQYDCSTKTTRRECEMPDFVDQLVQGSPRKLKGDYAPPAPTVRPYVAKSKQPVCRQVPVTVPKTCTKQEVAPVQYVCPDGGVLVGKSCRIDNVAPADVTCTAGDMDVATGRCLKVSITMPTWHCATGSDAGKNCVHYETLPADYVCPDGTEEAMAEGHYGKIKCVERKPQITFPDKVVKQQARMVCADGQLTGNTCTKVSHQPLEYMCPDGSFASEGLRSAELKCVVTAELIVPSPVETKVNPQYVCPDGKAASNRSCYTTEKVPIEEYCSTGMSLNYDGKCVATAELIVPSPAKKQIPAKALCNEGYTLQGKTCRSVETVPADKVCPPNYELTTNVGRETCEREHEMQAVCPPGTLQRPDGCVRRKVVAPEVTIVRTCTKGTPGCH